MRGRMSTCLSGLLLMLAWIASARAGTLTVATVNLGGGLWEYDLTLTDPYSFPLSGLNILQADTLFGLDSSSTITAPPGWDFFAPLPPVVDELNFFSLSSASDAQPGVPLAGFSFDSVTDPSTLPGALGFDVINADTGAQVPEPGSWLLLTTACLVLASLFAVRHAGVADRWRIRSTMRTIRWLLFVVLIAPLPARGDVITITLDPRSRTSVLEGTQGSVVFDITFNATVIEDAIGINPSPTLVSGDPTDNPTSFFGATSNCTGPIVPGYSCVFAVGFNTPPADDVFVPPDPDEGDWNVTGFVNYHTASDPTIITITSAPVLVIVADAPEPGTFILFGGALGLLSMIRLIRARMSQSPTPPRRTSW